MVFDVTGLLLVIYSYNSFENYLRKMENIQCVTATTISRLQERLCFNVLHIRIELGVLNGTS